jgi:hypothetical protein
MKANGVYTFRYNSTTGNFILQGDGSGGTALAADILTGKTATVDSGDITGTMPNRGAVAITPSTVDQAIAIGYHNGSGSVAGDANLLAANILDTAIIFGVQGTAIAGKRQANGTVTAVINSFYHKITVGGLAFTPRYVFAFYDNADVNILQTGANFNATPVNNYHYIDNTQNKIVGTTAQGTAVNQFRLLPDGFEMIVEYNTLSSNALSCNWLAIE